MKEYIIPILMFSLGCLAPLLRQLVKKTNSKIDDYLLEIALHYVKFVDGAFEGDKGESKKQRAFDLIQDELEKRNKFVPDEKINRVIEKAVTMKKVSDFEELVPLK